MRKLIVFMAAISMLFLSCGAVHKVQEKLSVKRDSSSAVKRDSSSAVKRDSSSHTVDKSVTTTNEHIVNEIDVPAKLMNNQVKLSDLYTRPNVVISNDGNDTLKVVYNQKDSTVKATLYQKAQKLRQTIDRTIQDFRDVDAKSKVTTDTKVNVKDDKKVDIHLDTDTNNTDVKREGIDWFKFGGFGVVFICFVLLIFWACKKFL